MRAREIRARATQAADLVLEVANESAAEERAKIVAWLRRERPWLKDLADAIESGEHLRETT